MNVFVKKYESKADAIVTNAILMPAGEVREDHPLPPYVYTENAAWDTGAQVTIISPRLVESLGLLPCGQGQFMGIGGDQVSDYVYLNTNDTLKFEGSVGEGVGITIVFDRAFSDSQDKGTYYSGQQTVSQLFGENVLLDAHAGGTSGRYHFGRIITVNLNASGGTLGTTTFEASPSQAYFPDYVEIPTRPGYKFLGYYGTFNSEERMWYDADGKYDVFFQPADYALDAGAAIPFADSARGSHYDSLLSVGVHDAQWRYRAYSARSQPSERHTY